VDSSLKDSFDYAAFVNTVKGMGLDHVKFDYMAEHDGTEMSIALSGIALSIGMVGQHCANFLLPLDERESGMRKAREILNVFFESQSI